MGGAQTNLEKLIVGVDPADLWIQTRSAQKFYFVREPTDVDGIELDDIATCLSRAPRYCGHTDQFYSVAQHSVLTAMLIRIRGGSATEQMMGLLHDATEAWMADIPSPLKKLIPVYSDIEKNIWDRVSYKFLGEVLELAPIVKECDLAMLTGEAIKCFAFPPIDNWTDRYADPADITISPWESKVAKAAFLNEHWHLDGLLAKEKAGMATVLA